MSTTCQTIINRALTKLGILGSSSATPTTADNALGLEALKGIYQRLINSGAFGQLTDVIVTSDYTAGENERIKTTSTVIITLPDQVSFVGYEPCAGYGQVGLFTDDNLVRPPRDLAVVSIVYTDNGTIQDYIYDNRLRQWVEINALTYTSVAPLALRDEGGLAATLAIDLADEFGQQPTALTLRAAGAFATALAFNISQAGEVIHRGDYY